MPKFPIRASGCHGITVITCMHDQQYVAEIRGQLHPKVDLLMLSVCDVSAFNIPDVEIHWTSEDHWLVRFPVRRAVLATDFVAL